MYLSIIFKNQINYAFFIATSIDYTAVAIKNLL